MKQVTYDINHKLLNTNAGFIAYWKVTFTLWRTVLNILGLIKMFSPWKSIYMIPWTFVVMIIKTPWFLFIKPFGQIYSRKTTWVGRFRERDGVILDSTVKKRVSHKLFGITFLKYPASMKKSDWEHLRK
jgi:hypothetical protein